MMNDWYERSMKALQLAGLAERSQYTYTCEVRLLVEFCGKTPDLISQEELEEYFLHRRNVTKWSAASLRVCYSGIRFFFEKVLQRDWNIFGYLRAERTKKLPAVLSQECPRRALLFIFLLKFQGIHTLFPKNHETPLPLAFNASITVPQNSLVSSRSRSASFRS